MKVKMKMVGFFSHEKGGFLEFMTQYSEKVRVFVSKSEIDHARNKYPDGSVAVMDVVPEIDRRDNSARLGIQLDMSTTELKF